MGARPVRRSTQGGQKIRRKRPAAACGEGCSSTLVLTQRYSIENIECGETRTKFVTRCAVIIVKGELAFLALPGNWVGPALLALGNQADYGFEPGFYLPTLLF